MARERLEIKLNRDRTVKFIFGKSMFSSRVSLINFF